MPQPYEIGVVKARHPEEEPLTPDMTPVDSTSIRSIGYDEASSTLYVEFADGATYIYDNVPQLIHQELLQAESVGGYFNRVIRANYSYSQV